MSRNIFSYLKISLDFWWQSCYNNCMNENDISYLIFLIFTVTGAYYFGKQIGIRGTIDYLEEQGVLNFDDSEK